MRLIKFAPLPSIEPRKRRYNSQVKLGVSSRSSMMRARRAALESVNNTNGNGIDYRSSEYGSRGGGGGNGNAAFGNYGSRQPRKLIGGDMWQDEVDARARSKSSKDRSASGPEPDPFVAMGRLMKNAWKRLSAQQMPNPPPLPKANIGKTGALSDIEDESEEDEESDGEKETGLEVLDRRRSRYGRDERIGEEVRVIVGEEHDFGYDEIEESQHPNSNGNGSAKYKISKPRIIRRASEPSNTLPITAEAR